MKILSLQFKNIAKIAQKISESVTERAFWVSLWIIFFFGIEGIDSQVACHIQASISALDPSISKAV